ncbi:DUF4123 domain-containing protein [Pseudomonas sp. NFIX28]|uniref:DUF4123 domain-containing protein n=1 Tax=Pseudomonas sp. NFIX28 TaxID=1566235 RepID=UPI00089697BA|nr:DUF4123 domain-containing protein [Pseudomonas sp. NFIX28]SDZ68325.1 protein of unknown function [Pseudomonas sp. NFIX28]
MSSLTASQAWAQAQSNAQPRYAIVETGLLSDESRMRFLKSDFSRYPIMRQNEFAELREYGPWLVDVSPLTFDEFSTHKLFSDRQALMGWISSDCPGDQLNEHLSDALLAKNEVEEVLLIRSYAPEVLPLLHARPDLPWHPWLFGPLKEWWLPTDDNDWQRFQGGSNKQLSEYHPITLDAQLWQALELDPLAYNLVTELERSAPEVFTSSCHGDRLTQVEKAIDTARKEGLETPEDVSLFATLNLFDREFPSNWSKWSQAKTLVRQEKLPLGLIMRQLSE